MYINIILKKQYFYVLMIICLNFITINAINLTTRNAINIINKFYIN